MIGHPIKSTGQQILNIADKNLGVLTTSVDKAQDSSRLCKKQDLLTALLWAFPLPKFPNEMGKYLNHKIFY
ncbi:hypothetical protein ACTXT7_001089 [Hymenolepis weldensis]